ncbi:hypothetical protein D3C76_1827610 [compost metagenome]
MMIEEIVFNLDQRTAYFNDSQSGKLYKAYINYDGTIPITIGIGAENSNSTIISQSLAKMNGTFYWGN